MHGQPNFHKLFVHMHISKIWLYTSNKTKFRNMHIYMVFSYGAAMLDRVTSRTLYHLSIATGREKLLKQFLYKTGYLFLSFRVFFVSIISEFLSDWCQLVNGWHNVIVSYKPIGQQPLVVIIFDPFENFLKFLSIYLRWEGSVTIFLGQECLRWGKKWVY